MSKLIEILERPPSNTNLGGLLGFRFEMGGGLHPV